jgi:hypothetical protein
MSDRSILQRVHELVEEEVALRESADEPGGRLAAIEHELDQCWDLLRQRRGMVEFGRDPEESQSLDIRTVESVGG